ncbi:hypothetical protein GJAV_G00060210 [Gymnothorax javanicus]|nr:hypothetical protein GJAV_G00060210 [Gymnothorax javanicus]
MQGTSIAMAVFIPVTLILIIIIGIYFCFSRVQGKSLCLPMSTSTPYGHISVESTFDNPTYETAVSPTLIHSISSHSLIH